MTIYRLTLTVVAALCLAGCSGSSGGEQPPSNNSSSSTTPPSPPPPPATPPPPTGPALFGGGSASFTLSWTPPLAYTNGSALTDLAGYKIYVGRETGQYSEVVSVDTPGLARFVVDNLPLDTYFVVMTAYNNEGIESGYSMEVAALAN